MFRERSHIVSSTRLSCVSRHFHPLHQPSRRRYFALCRVFRWCLLAQRALWSSMVVIRTPPCAKESRLRECRKNLARQQLVAQSGVETFNDSVPQLPSIHGMRFHRSNHAAHSRQALSDGALLRLVFQQDAWAAQEACRGGTGGGPRASPRQQRSRGVVRSQARRLKSSNIVSPSRGAFRHDRGAS